MPPVKALSVQDLVQVALARWADLLARQAQALSVKGALTAIHKAVACMITVKVLTVQAMNKRGFDGKSLDKTENRTFDRAGFDNKDFEDRFGGDN